MAQPYIASARRLGQPYLTDLSVKKMYHFFTSATLSANSLLNIIIADYARQLLGAIRVSHQPPLVVIARKPDFADIGKRLILIYLTRRQMTVIINNRQIFYRIVYPPRQESAARR